MQVKRFFAADMRTAMKLVRDAQQAALDKIVKYANTNKVE